MVISPNLVEMLRIVNGNFFKITYFRVLAIIMTSQVTVLFIPRFVLQ